jgi:hypothetical protein
MTTSPATTLAVSHASCSEGEASRRTQGDQGGGGLKQRERAYTSTFGRHRQRQYARSASADEHPTEAERVLECEIDAGKLPFAGASSVLRASGRRTVRDRVAVVCLQGRLDIAGLGLDRPGNGGAEAR